GSRPTPPCVRGAILMPMIGRLAVVSLGLFSASVPSTLALRRHYGRRPAARFAIGSVLAIVAQQALVGVAASRRNARLTAVDAMTLSRGFGAMRRVPYERIFKDEPGWARPLGIAQMALFTAALAPFGAAGTRLALRLATPIVAPLQLLGMLLLYRRSQTSFGR